MATTWSAPKTPLPFDGSIRCALAVCTTGTEAATAGATDGIDCRGLASVQPVIETVAKAAGTIDIAGMVPGDTVTIGGTVFTAVGENAQPSAVQFKVGADKGPDRGDDWITAANLAAAVNANGVGGTVGAFVSSDVNRVTITALADGVGGNAITLATSSARAVVSGATLAGGLAAGAIGVGASLQVSGLNPMTGRWMRIPDMDVPLTAGLVSQMLPPIPVPLGYWSRIQALPNNVGAACNVYHNGAAGRIP